MASKTVTRSILRRKIESWSFRKTTKKNSKTKENKKGTKVKCLFDNTLFLPVVCLYFLVVYGLFLLLVPLSRPAVRKSELFSTECKWNGTVKGRCLDQGFAKPNLSLFQIALSERRPNPAPSFDLSDKLRQNGLLATQYVWKLNCDGRAPLQVIFSIHCAICREQCPNCFRSEKIFKWIIIKKYKCLLY